MITNEKGWQDHLDYRKEVKQTLAVLTESVAESHRGIAQNTQSVKELKEMVEQRMLAKEELEFVKKEWNDDKWRSETWKRVSKASLFLIAVIGGILTFEVFIDKVKSYFFVGKSGG